MIKFIAAALWLCAVAVGTVLWSAKAPPAEAAAGEAGAGSFLSKLEEIKMEIISVPVLRDDHIAGYFLARLVYTADEEEVKKLPVSPDTLLTDQFYTYLFGNPEIDFTDKAHFDIDAFRNSLRESVNKRVGAPVIHDVLVQQLDFLSKDEIRDNVVRRRTGGAKSGNKVLSPDSHF